MAHGPGCGCAVCLYAQGQADWGDTFFDIFLRLPILLFLAAGLGWLLVSSGEAWPITALAIAGVYFAIRARLRPPSDQGRG